MFWHHTIKGGPVSRPHLAYWRLGSAFVWSMSCFSSSYSSRHHSQAQNHSIALYLPGVPAPGPNPGNHHLFSLRRQGSVSRRISCEWSCTVHELWFLCNSSELCDANACSLSILNCVPGGCTTDCPLTVLKDIGVVSRLGRIFVELFWASGRNCCMELNFHFLRVNIMEGLMRHMSSVCPPFWGAAVCVPEWLLSHQLSFRAPAISHPCHYLPLSEYFILSWVWLHF